MTMPAYQPMAPILPEGESGDAKIQHRTITQHDAEFSALRAVVTGNPNATLSEGTIAQLLVNNYLVMSDTQMEQRTNNDFLYAASKAGGDILIGGLGLGMILVPLVQMKKVRSVLVVEKSQGVIDLVASPLLTHLKTDKLSIVRGDIFRWRPPPGRQHWDVIYFDIWADLCVDNLTEITKLKRKFSRCLNRGKGGNPEAWMGAWEEERLRYLKRRGRWR
jgi:hypothetical protein